MKTLFDKSGMKPNVLYREMFNNKDYQGTHKCNKILVKLTMSNTVSSSGDKMSRDRVHNI